MPVLRRSHRKAKALPDSRSPPSADDDMEAGDAPAEPMSELSESV